MSPGVAFLILRVFLAILMYSFLGVIGWLLWQDLKVASRETSGASQTGGRLVAVAGNPIYPLLSMSSIGRALTNTITIPDDTVSLQHAMISQRKGRWWLEDMGSRNGTALNGVSISSAVFISPGDLIKFGSAELRFEIEQQDSH